MSLLVNLFGGPGTGKSTQAALLFGALKMNGVNAEMAHEFAKDLTWEERHTALAFQPYIAAKQMYRVHRLQDKVDCIVTDSPILLSLVYKGQGYSHAFAAHLLEVYRTWDTLNVFLMRDTHFHPYNPKGRNQTEEEAMEIDARIVLMLSENKVKFHTIKMDRMVNNVLAELTADALRERGVI